MEPSKFAQIVVDQKSGASRVLENLNVLIKTYGRADVADLYDLVGITSLTFEDTRWGWNEALDEASIKDVPGGFLLDLPQPVALR